MDWPLYWRLPPKAESTSDQILDRFLDYVLSKDLELYPAQEEAILALLEGKNVILNTPTGSGKSLVAMALHFQSLAKGRRSFYTCPIKALVNEKFRDLCAVFGPDQVGMITGDGAVNAQAPIICCTAEILSNVALREGPLANVDDVVMDEFHYYSDKQRGVAWQIPLLALPQTRFLLMSATLGDMEFFSKTLTDLNHQPTDIVRSGDRPVPLEFEYRETPLHETVADLVQRGLAPIYMVSFSQREAAEETQNLMSVDFATKEEKKKIQEALQGVQFQSPYGKEIYKVLRHGIGLHHAGLLPKYRVLVEKMAQQGLLKVISGTDTLGVGVNVPIRTVLFTKLCKYDGEKTAILGVREFHQIAGRAGRRGYDTRGTVVAQAPEHVIENLKLKRKAADDPKKMKKLVLKNPPPHGFVMWTKDTFNKLITSLPEPLVSRFQVNHGMLLNVLSRQNGRRAMQELIRKSHGSSASKKSLRSSAFELFRSLADRKIVEYVRSESGPVQIRVNMDLQTDFSLNQSLALYLLDTLQSIDPQSENYALDVLTLVESILESPDLILRKQLDRVKTEKMAEMKAAGVEYDERIEELEKLEHPKPNRDFIYSTFNTFREAHPWVGQENIRPKSIAREMYENFQSFAEYIREYDLQRIEGLLLRYLSEVYKVLEQTVPEAAKDEELRAMAAYFGAMVRQVDSSLLDDWEKMRTGGEIDSTVRSGQENSTVEKSKLDAKAATLLLRNQIHSLVRVLSLKDYEAFLTLVQADESWTVNELERKMLGYYQGHLRIDIGPAARTTEYTHIETSQDGYWKIEQTLTDPEGHNDWEIRFEADLACLQEGAKPALILKSIGEIGSVTS
jgi:superfamily II RNA helicase